VARATSLLLPGINEKLPFLAPVELLFLEVLDVAVLAGISEGEDLGDCELGIVWGGLKEEDPVGDAAFLELRRNLL
jgi:hypothetical protein